MWVGGVGHLSRGRDGCPKRPFGSDADLALGWLSINQEFAFSAMDLPRLSIGDFRSIAALFFSGKEQQSYILPLLVRSQGRRCHRRDNPFCVA